MPGPRPKPTHLKILHGNPGGKPLNKHEPKPAGDLKDAPGHFDAELRAAWDCAIKHAPRGLLKKCDSAILETWCAALVLQRRSLVELMKSGVAVPSKEGKDSQSPHLLALAKCSQIMLRATDHLGFSPASRSRITTGDTTSSFGAWEDVSA